MAHEFFKAEQAISHKGQADQGSEWRLYRQERREPLELPYSTGKKVSRRTIAKDHCEYKLDLT